MARTRSGPHRRTGPCAYRASRALAGAAVPRRGTRPARRGRPWPAPCPPSASPAPVFFRKERTWVSPRRTPVSRSEHLHLALHARVGMMEPLVANLFHDLLAEFKGAHGGRSLQACPDLTMLYGRG